MILYRKRYLKSEEPKLEDIYAILSERAVHEGGAVTGEVGSGDQVAQHIHPNEPDVIQAVRRRLRASGKAYNTEKAYVKWIRRLMRSYEIRSQCDFAKIEWQQ